MLFKSILVLLASLPFYLHAHTADECERFFGSPVAIKFDAAAVVARDAADLPEIRTMFETSFEVRSTTVNARAAVLGHIRDWVTKLKLVNHEDRGFLRQILKDRQDAEFTQITAEDGRVKIILANRTAWGETPTASAFLIEHPDGRDPHEFWRVDVAIDVMDVETIHLGMVVSNWRDDGRRMTRHRIDTSPKALRGILDDPQLSALSGRMPMALTAFQLTPEGVPDFLRAIMDRDRALPMVYISRDYRTKQLPFDENVLVNRLRGFATVVVEAEPSGPVFEVTALLNKRFGKAAAANGSALVFEAGTGQVHRFNLRADDAPADFSDRIAVRVLSNNQAVVRMDRHGWTTSIFDLLP